MKRNTTLPQGSNERKEIPLYRGPLRYFPAAIAGIARICKIGNDKHNPGEEMHHARGKSMDHADCIVRHLVDLAEDFGAGVGRDENGVPQVDYLAWRACALAQQWHEDNGAPLAPGARLPKLTQPDERRSGPVDRRKTAHGDGGLVAGRVLLRRGISPHQSVYGRRHGDRERWKQ